jgi:RHS repeat-associated protein
MNRRPRGKRAPTADSKPLFIGERSIRVLPGQYYDAEIGTNYNYARDYDPTTGRYEQSDPVGLLGGLGTFTYSQSNPISLSDPTGRQAILYLGAGVVVVGACGVLGCVLWANYHCSISYPNHRDLLSPDYPKFTKCVEDLTTICVETGFFLIDPTGESAKKLGEHLGPRNPRLTLPVQPPEERLPENRMQPE